jgi:hypothetical protein
VQVNLPDSKYVAVVFGNLSNAVMLNESTGGISILSDGLTINVVGVCHRNIFRL